MCIGSTRWFMLLFNIQLAWFSFKLLVSHQISNTHELNTSAISSIPLNWSIFLLAIFPFSQILGESISIWIWPVVSIEGHLRWNLLVCCQKFINFVGADLMTTSGFVWGWHAPCELPRTSRPSSFPFHWARVFITNLCYLKRLKKN